MRNRRIHENKDQSCVTQHRHLYFRKKIIEIGASKVIKSKTLPARKWTIASYLRIPYTLEFRRNIRWSTLFTKCYLSHKNTLPQARFKDYLGCKLSSKHFFKPQWILKCPLSLLLVLDCKNRWNLHITIHTLWFFVSESNFYHKSPKIWVELLSAGIEPRI